MELDPARCYRALTARDARFDGRFFVGVRTTGIYCRPICPARTPMLRNITFYPSAAAAADAGLRPCRRCRPETSPGTPAWQGTSATVTRGLRLVADGALDESSVDDLAGRLGIGERHLRRLFLEHLGASPVSVAQTRRLHFAKKLIDETALPMTRVAIAAGYQSVRRFNTAILEAYGVSPSKLRRASASVRASPSSVDPAGDGAITLRLSYRAPIAFEALLAFLARRAIPGVESVDGGVYRRSLELDGQSFRIEVQTGRTPGAVLLRVPADQAGKLARIVDIVRGVFDLDADPAAISDVLDRDALLSPMLAATPGLRVPGAADPHELAVRAILGQQISVAGARTLASRLVVRFGRALPDIDPDGALTHTFPSARSLADADVASIGLTTKRAQAIRAVSRAIADQHVVLTPGSAPESAREALLAIPGIGRWTADYIAMRALREPDAFPSGDLVLRRAASTTRVALRERELSALAENWRPWRAYAVIALWNSAS